MIYRVTSRYRVAGNPVDASTTEIQPDAVHALRSHCDIINVRVIDKVIITRIGSGEDTGGEHNVPVTEESIALLNVNLTHHDQLQEAFNG